MSKHIQPLVIIAEYQSSLSLCLQFQQKNSFYQGHRTITVEWSLLGFHSIWCPLQNSSVAFSTWHRLAFKKQTNKQTCTRFKTYGSYVVTILGGMQGLQGTAIPLPGSHFRLCLVRTEWTKECDAWDDKTNKLLACNVLTDLEYKSFICSELLILFKFKCV